MAKSTAGEMLGSLGVEVIVMGGLRLEGRSVRPAEALGAAAEVTISAI